MNLITLELCILLSILILEFVKRYITKSITDIILMIAQFTLAVGGIIFVVGRFIMEVK